MTDNFYFRCVMCNTTTGPDNIDRNEIQQIWANRRKLAVLASACEISPDFVDVGVSVFGQMTDQRFLAWIRKHADHYVIGESPTAPTLEFRKESVHA